MTRGSTDVMPWLDRFQNAGEYLIQAADAIDHGQLPPDFDVRQGAVAVVSFVHGLIANWVLTPDLFDIKRDAPALIEGLLQMLKSGLGRTPP